MNEKNINELLIEADQLRAEKKFKKAISIYLRLFNKFGISENLAVALGSCYYNVAIRDWKLEKFNKAIKWYREALKINPKNAEVHYSLANIYWDDLLEYDLAAQEIRKAIQINPNFSRALVTPSIWFYGPPDVNVFTFEEVLNWLRTAMVMDPDNPHYYFRLEQLCLETGQLSLAKEAVTKSLSGEKPLGISRTAALSLLNKINDAISDKIE